MPELSSIGVRFYYSTDDVTYTTIGCILDINYPGFEKDIKEGTCLSQTTDRYKTFFGGFIDAGEVTLKIKFNKSMFTVLMGYADDQEPIYFRIVVPDGSDLSDVTTCSRLKGLGLIKSGPGLEFPTDGDKVGIPVTIKWSGALTWTPAS